MVAKHFLPLLAKGRKSAFAALSARVGSIGDNRLGGWHSYRASKAALVQFTKSAAIDLGKHNIRVNCIVPGHIRTELSSFSEKGAEDAAAQRLEKAVDAVYLSNQLLKRRGDPEDAAEVALFLASDKAKYVTGIAMPVDGGVTAGDPVNHLSDIIAARTNALKGG